MLLWETLAAVGRPRSAGGGGGDSCCGMEAPAVSLDTCNCVEPPVPVRAQFRDSCFCSAPSKQPNSRHCTVTPSSTLSSQGPVTSLGCRDPSSPCSRHPLPGPGSAGFAAVSLHVAPSGSGRLRRKPKGPVVPEPEAMHVQRTCTGTHHTQNRNTPMRCTEQGHP